MLLYGNDEDKLEIRELEALMRAYIKAIRSGSFHLIQGVLHLDAKVFYPAIYMCAQHFSEKYHDLLADPSYDAMFKILAVHGNDRAAIEIKEVCLG